MRHKLFEIYNGFFSQSMQKTEESNAYPFQCLMNESLLLLKEPVNIMQSFN